MIEPDDPLDAVPELKAKEPLRPLLPALIDRMVIEPLLVAPPYPDVIVIYPPVRGSD